MPAHPSDPVRALAAGLLLLLLPGSGAGALVINELLPDPPGTDAGHEFVEFLNQSDQPFVMEGVEFQFANGAEGPVWRTRWLAPDTLVLAPGARFLLVDRLWAGPPAADAEATLGLQNGPDAVRLVRGDEVLDLVGYGALTDPALSEGAPAALEPGRALARRPDGRDTGDNAADLVAAEPTPGAPNFRRWSAAAGTPTFEPPSLLRPGDAFTVQTELRNNGLEDWPAATAVLTVGGGTTAAQLGPLPAGGERPIAWIVRPPAAGSVAVSAALLPAGAPDSLRLDLGRLQVGPAALVLNEVLGTPAAGQGEWLELLAPGPDSVDLAGWAVRDEDGGWHDLPAVGLAPGDLCVVAQDSAALAAWLDDVERHGGAPACPAFVARARLVALPGWPTLNNTAPADRSFADRVHLRAPDGRTADHVTLGLAGGPDRPGRSLERAAIGAVNPRGTPWAASTAGPGSTPGCPNATALTEAAAGPDLRLAPALLDRAGGAAAVHALFAVVAEAAGWRLRVYDLWGVAVRDFGGDTLGAGPRDLLWDGYDDAGCAVPPGGYVFVLETWADGTQPRRSRRLCAVR